MRTCLLAFCVLISGTIVAGEPPRLADSGLAAGRGEEVLPLGAALHVRLADPLRTLEALDALAQQFIPEEFLPAELRQAIVQPRGLLQHVGRQTIGAPLDAAALAALAGVDARRPVSLTLYPAPGTLGWVLCLPVADHRTLGGLLVNLTRARSFTAAAINGRPAWVVEGSNPDLPLRLVVLCSADAAYLCSDERIATLLGGGAHLSADPVVAAAAVEADLTLAICAMPARPLIQMIAQQFARLPPRLLDGPRDQLLRNLGKEGASSLNLQLRLHTGLTSIQECFDYLECLAGAAAETFVPALAKRLMGVDGASLSLALRPEGVRASLLVQAAGIESLAAKPLPLPELTAALATLPGDRLWFAATGGRAPAQPGSLRADWLELATRKLAAKNLASAFLPAVAAYWRAEERAPLLEDKVGWLLRTSTRPQTVVPAGPGFAAWLAAIQATVPTPDLEVMPRLNGDIVAFTFAERAGVENRNAARWTRVLADTLGDARWVDPVSRFRREPREGKAERLVYEDAWVTRNGMLGYSQHELVNRIIAYSAQRGPLQLLQRVDGDRTCWLDDPPAAPLPLPPALLELIAQVPDGADVVAVARALPALAALLGGADALEQAARHDLDAYLAACIAAINGNVGNQQAVIAALQRIAMPLPVVSLNIDATRNLYLVLPGDLRYPRPLVVPVLRQLLAGFLERAESGGGMVAWTRPQPGRMQAVVHQDLRALAWLVKLTGNAVHRTFFAGGDPLGALRKTLGQAGDGEPNDSDQVIFYNTVWPGAHGR